MTDDEKPETKSVFVWEYFPEHPSFPLAGGKWKIANCLLSPMDLTEQTQWSQDYLWERWLDWSAGSAEALPAIVAIGYKYSKTGIILTNVAYSSMELWHGNEPPLPHLDALLASVGADHIAGLESVQIVCLRKTVGIKIPKTSIRPRSRHV